MTAYRAPTQTELKCLRAYILRNNMKFNGGIEPTISELSKGQIQFYDDGGFRFANYWHQKGCLKEIPATELQPN